MKSETLLSRVEAVASDGTWFKVPLENIKSESGAERLGLVSMHAGEVRGAVVDLSGPLPSLTHDTFLAKFGYFYRLCRGTLTVRTTHPVYRVLGTQAVRGARLGPKLVPQCPCDTLIGL